MSKQRLHPERVLMVLLGILLPTTWVLCLAGFITGNRQFYTWATGVLIATLVIAFTPLAAFLVLNVADKLRRNRDQE